MKPDEKQEQKLLKPPSKTLEGRRKLFFLTSLEERVDWKQEEFWNHFLEATSRSPLQKSSVKTWKDPGRTFDTLGRTPSNFSKLFLKSLEEVHFASGRTSEPFSKVHGSWSGGTQEGVQEHFSCFVGTPFFERLEQHRKVLGRSQEGPRKVLGRLWKLLGSFQEGNRKGQ